MAHQHILGYLVLEESLEISGTDITKGDHTVLLHTHTCICSCCSFTNHAKDSQFQLSLLHCVPKKADHQTHGSNQGCSLKTKVLISRCLKDMKNGFGLKINVLVLTKKSRYFQELDELECGPMPNVMAALGI